MASNTDDGGTGCLVVFLSVAVLGWWLGWWGTREEWTGYVYPDVGNMERHFLVGPFKKFEECQQSAINALRAIPGAAVGGAYECGLNCKPSEYGFNVCKETRK